MGSVFFLQLFCLWGINSYLYSLYSTLLLSHSKSNLYMAQTIMVFSLQLLCLFLCSHYGVDVKFSLAFCVGIYLLSTFGWHYFANQLIGIRIRNVVRDLLPYAGATIIAIGVAWLVSRAAVDLYVSLMIKIIITAVIYANLLWFAGSTLLRESILYFKISVNEERSR